MSNVIRLSDTSKRLNTERCGVKSWRDLAARYGVPQGVLCDLANRGIEPRKREYRERLGLPLVSVVYVVGGNIPADCMVLGSYRTCACGQRFAPNHPARHKCFKCSPFKGG